MQKKFLFVLFFAFAAVAVQAQQKKLDAAKPGLITQKKKFKGAPASRISASHKSKEVVKFTPPVIVRDDEKMTKPKKG